MANKRGNKMWLWWWVLAALGIGLVVLGVVWWFSSQQLTATPTTPICTPQDLTLSVGNTEGTAGTTYMHATVTNKGDHMCTVSGYPIVDLFDKNNVRLGTDAQHNNLYGSDLVAVAPGGVAHVVVGFPDAGNFDPGICNATSTTLRLYLPGGAFSNPLTATLQQHACPGFSTTTFQPGA